MKGNWILVILGFIFIVVGSMIAFYELTEYQYIDHTFDRDGTVYQEENWSYDVSAVERLYIDGYANDASIVIDDEMGDKVSVNIKVYSELYKLRLYEYDDEYQIEEENVKTHSLIITYDNNETDFRRIRMYMDEIIEDLRNKKFRSYDRYVDYDIVIKVSSSNKDKINLYY